MSLFFGFEKSGYGSIRTRRRFETIISKDGGLCVFPALISNCILDICAFMAGTCWVERFVGDTYHQLHALPFDFIYVICWLKMALHICAFQMSGTLVKLDAENLVRISRKDKFMVLLRIYN